MFVTELLVMAAMIAFNSVFAAYEIALASLTLARIHVLVGKRRKGVHAAAYMKENMEGSLAGIQLGITLVGAVAAATGGAGAEEAIAPAIQESWGVSPGLGDLLAILCVVVPLTFATIVFGELIPKVFALRNKELVCLSLSPSMKWFVTLVWPVVWVLETTVSRLMAGAEKLLKLGHAGPSVAESAELQELRASVALARTSRLLGAQEERIILGAAALTTRTVREAMLAADAICMLDADSAIGDALIAAHLDMHTRFPVAERHGDPQSIIGYVNFKDIIAHMRLVPHDPSLRKIVREIPSLQASAPISVCLEQMIREHVHIALIRDEQQHVLGMVTLEDLMEELVGEIEDEYDRLPVHVAASGNGWVVGGGITLEKLQSTTGIELPPLDCVETTRHLSDWICRQLAEPVHGGEVVEKGPFRAVVRKVRRNHVLEALIESNANPRAT